jgi:hypothetical protein
VNGFKSVKNLEIRMKFKKENYMYRRVVGEIFF